MLMKMNRHMAVIPLLLVVSLTAAAATNPGLRELTALEAIQLAVRNDSGLRQADFSLTLARLDLEAAQYSAFFPSVGFSIDLPKLTADGLEAAIGGALTATVPLPWGTGDAAASVGVLYDLDASKFVPPTWRLALSDAFDVARPSSRMNAIASKQRSVDSAETAYLQAKGNLVISTLRDFSDLLAEARQVEVDRQSVDRQQAKLEQAQQLAAQGYKGDQALAEARLALLDAQIQAERSGETYASDLEAFLRETLGLSENCQLAPLDPSMDELLAASHRLLADDIPDSAISDTPGVLSARQSVEEAKDALREARNGALPSLSVEASADATQWSFGVGLSFDLFTPDRWTRVAIAETNLKLAEEKFESARQSVRNQILDQRASLLSATRSGERLALEKEKWQLEEQVMSVKHDAGSISDTDWAEFLVEKDAFAADAAGRAASLLVSHLTYRSALGLELDWEGWL